METLMVIAILAILASIAVPGFAKARVRAAVEMSEVVLLTIYAGEQLYKSRNDEYLLIGFPVGFADPAMWNKIYVDLPFDPAGAQKDVLFLVQPADKAAFTATAYILKGGG